MYPVLPWSEFRPDLHQAFMINVHYTQNMNNIQLFMCEVSQKIHNSYDKIGICTIFWHRAKVYFMCQKLLRWLNTVPDMNKIY